MSITEREYRADPRMNVSLLVNGIKSMRHLKYAMENPTEQTPAMRLGTMAHVRLLQPDVFDTRYVQMPAYELEEWNVTQAGKRTQSTATSYVKTRREEFVLENGEREIITQSDLDWCDGMRDSVLADPMAAKLIENCVAEVPVFGTIEGVECKGLIDLLGTPIMADLKTTVDVSPHRFGSKAAQLNYPFRLAFYRELARQNGGDIEDVYLIAVESKAPFDCVVSEVADVVLDNAMDQVRRVLKEYKACLKSGAWPGVSAGEVLPLSIPNWAMSEDDELDWSAA